MTKPVLLLCGFSLVAASVWAESAPAKTEMPPHITGGIARMVQTTDARNTHIQCVLKAFEKNGLNNDAAITSHAQQRQMGPALYQALADHIDERALLATFAPSSKNLSKDALQLEQSTFMLNKLLGGDTSNGLEALDTLNALYAYMQVINVSLQSPCAEPAEMVVLANEKKALEPVEKELQRLHTCTQAELKTRKLGEDQAFSLLDKDPNAPALRTYLLQRAQSSPMASSTTPAQLAKLPMNELVFIGMSGSMGAAENYTALMRSMAGYGLLLNRALGNPCKPSAEAVQFADLPQ